MSKKDLVKKVQDKLAQSNTVQEAKEVSKFLQPLIEEYKTKKTNEFEVAKLITLITKQVVEKNLSQEGKRSILFTIRDNGFLDSAQTQHLWLDLADIWEVENLLPHMVRKLKES